MKNALTIAGSDPSGGAGIQADIKTFMACGIYAQSVICSLTAQNTMGVYGIYDIPDDFVRDQMDAVFTDIVPDAVKIGMLSNRSIMETVYDSLKKYGAKNIVIDPVMVSTSGSRLTDDDAASFLFDSLFKIADLITPNIPEAELLSGITIRKREDMIKAAHIIEKSCGCAILIKGGHAKTGADDFLSSREGSKWYSADRIDNPNTHGTGCTLSSAIAAYLAKGYRMDEAVFKAKEYLNGAIAAGLNLGRGRGPLDHAYKIQEDT